MRSFLCHAFFPPVSTWDSTMALYGRRLGSGDASLDSTVICGNQRSPCRQASITLSQLRRPSLSIYPSDNLFALTHCFAFDDCLFTVLRRYWVYKENKRSLVFQAWVQPYQGHFYEAVGIVACGWGLPLAWHRPKRSPGLERMDKVINVPLQKP